MDDPRKATGRDSKTGGDGGETASSRETGRVMSRRGLLAAGSTTAALAVAGCTGGGGGGDGPLTVSTWSGTNQTVFENTIKPMYEEETGNSLQVVGNWSNILGKIRQSPSDSPPFDLTVGSTRDHYLGNQDDLWEPIRYDNIPNTETVKPALSENIVSDNGVPVAYGIMGYAYDQDAIEFQPESWSDLVTNEKAENLVLPGSYFLNAVLMGAIVADEAPMADELYDESQRDVIFETLSEMPVSKFYSGAQDMWTAISQGIGDVGQYFYAYTVAKARETDELNIGVHVPDQTVGYIDHYQIARGSSNRTQAEEFINFLLREDVQTAYADAFNLGMANENASYPEATREQVPLGNDELDENVVFKKYARIAEAAPKLNERYKQLQNQF